MSLKMWRDGESRRKVTLVTCIRHRWAWKAAGAVGSVVRDEAKNCCRRACMEDAAAERIAKEPKKAVCMRETLIARNPVREASYIHSYSRQEVSMMCMGYL
jgi:hypothetical protein